jgi:hypothetical protein
MLIAPGVLGTTAVTLSAADQSGLRTTTLTAALAATWLGRNNSACAQDDGNR